MTTVVELSLGADVAAWRAAGFTVADGVVQLGGIGVRCIEGAAGITSWMLAAAPDEYAAVSDIDGLATLHGEPTAAVPGVHPNGVTGIDHLVVYTPDLEQTCAAIEAATGAPLKRIREVGALRQGFHRLGELIVEVVSLPGVAVERATFWGLAFNVTDIDAMYVTCGDDVMSAPKDAVQPGRRISSFRDSAGLGTPVAVMTPHVRRG